MKNISHLKEKLKHRELIQNNEDEKSFCVEILTKVLWNITFIANRITLDSTNSSGVGEVLNMTIEIFNNLVSQMEEHTILETQKHRMEQVFVFLNLRHKILKVKKNINIEAIRQKFYCEVNNFDYYNYEEFIKFKEICTNILNKEYQMATVEEDPLSFDLVNYLHPQLRENQRQRVIFLNEPYNSVGFHKLRNSLCKDLGYEVLEIDYNEYINFKLNSEKTDEELIREFLIFKVK